MEYELIITYKCNWNCEYCCVDTHNKKEPINIFKKICSIPDGAQVTLSGGEPGTLTKNKLYKILSKLEEKKCDVGVNTNGLFIKKYPDLIAKFITNINYHVTENLDISDEIIFIDNRNIKIDYLIIVHDKNINKLKIFLDKYPEIKFNIIAASNPLSGIQTAPTLNHKNKINILKNFYNRLTEDSKKRLIKEKNFNDIIYLT